MASLQAALSTDRTFVVAVEIVTSRGLISASKGRGILERARELAADPRIDVLSITDNPGRARNARTRHAWDRSRVAGAGGVCEVYSSECICSSAYERLKAYGEEEAMLNGPVVVKDNALDDTSAWANMFLGRDHLRFAARTAAVGEDASVPEAGATRR